MRQTDFGSMEPWVVISTDLNDCAVMDIIQGDPNLGTYFLYFKRRVDNTPIVAGYLSTRA